MLQIVILFITATLGFICFATIYNKSLLKDKSLINKYMLIIVGFQSVRFLAYAILLANPNLNLNWFSKLIDVLAISLLPCFYLYFENVVCENKFKTVKLVHFIPPVFLIFTFTISNFFSLENEHIIKKIFIYSSILISCMYLFFCFQLIKKHVWKRKSEIKVIQNQNILITKWIIFLFTCFLLLVTNRYIILFFKKSFDFDFHLIWITGLLWNIIFIKILLTPEILYGFNFLNKSIDDITEKVVLKSVWKIDGPLKSITNEKDIKIAEKIASKLTKYIHEIEELSFHSTIFRNPKLGLEDIAAEIKIPVSNVSFIFRFHCNESFSDYKKIVRIHDATKLLEEGFLYDKTVESLAEKVGFSSYITFYNAFKSIMGVTTQEYVKRF